jgi:hypothetical protein
MSGAYRAAEADSSQLIGRLAAELRPFVRGCCVLLVSECSWLVGERRGGKRAFKFVICSEVSEGNGLTIIIIVLL